jgi:hypothetical protein
VVAQFIGLTVIFLQKKVGPINSATMTIMAKKSKPTEKQPKVHDELKGFDIKINAFGELNSSMNIERLNQFLNEKVDDIKLRDRKQTKDEEE